MEIKDSTLENALRVGFELKGILVDKYPEEEKEKGF